MGGGNSKAIAEWNDASTRYLWLYSCSAVDISNVYTVSEWDGQQYTPISGWEVGFTQEEEGWPCAQTGEGQNYIGGIKVGAALDSMQQFEIKKALEGEEEKIAQCNITVEEGWTEDVGLSCYLGFNEGNNEGKRGLFYWHTDSSSQIRVDNGVANVNCSGDPLN